MPAPGSGGVGRRAPGWHRRRRSGAPTGGAGGSAAGAPAGRSARRRGGRRWPGRRDGRRHGRRASRHGRNSRGGSSGGSAAGGGARPPVAGAAARPAARAAPSIPVRTATATSRSAPTYTRQSDLTSKGAPAGKIFSFTMNSAASTIYTGLDTTLTPTEGVQPRHQRVRPRALQGRDRRPVHGHSRRPDQMLSTPPTSGALGNVTLALDNLTISDRSRSGGCRRSSRSPSRTAARDSQGSERGLEYDTMSDRYARFIDTEVLPAVLANAQIKAAYPNLGVHRRSGGTGTIGCSSGGAAALDDGLVPPATCSAADHLLGHVRRPAGRRRAGGADVSARRLGVPLEPGLIANSRPKPLRIFVHANDSDNGCRRARERTITTGCSPTSARPPRSRPRATTTASCAGENAGHCDGNVFRTPRWPTRWSGLARLPDQLTRGSAREPPQPEAAAVAAAGPVSPMSDRISPRTLKLIGFVMWRSKPAAAARVRSSG